MGTHHKAPPHKNSWTNLCSGCPCNPKDGCISAAGPPSNQVGYSFALHSLPHCFPAENPCLTAKADIQSFLSDFPMLMLPTFQTPCRMTSP